MALSGRSTLTVLMADRFSLSTSRLYSRALKERKETRRGGRSRSVASSRPDQFPVTEKMTFLSLRCARRKAGEKTALLCGARSSPERNFVAQGKWVETFHSSNAIRVVSFLLWRVYMDKSLIQELSLLGGGIICPPGQVPLLVSALLFPFSPYFPRVVPAERPPAPSLGLPHFSLVKKCDQN